MTAIKKIRSSRLRNEAHYEFLVVFHSLLNRFPAVKQLVNALYATFAELLDRERQFVDAAKESLLTAKLVEADRRVDRDLSAMRHIIRAAKNHFDPATVEAAGQLFGRLKDFGYVCTKSYEEESAAVQVLVGDLQTAFAPQAQAVGLTPWVSELADAEAAFTALYLQRNAEIAARPQGTMTQARRDVEDVYRKMLVVIQNSLITTGEAVCGQFARELNEAIKYASEHLHRKPRIDIAAAVVASIADQPYTGRPVIIIPDVCYGLEPLVMATDFSLAYADNVRPGNARLILRGTGRFKGVKTITFNIVDGI